MSTKQRRPIGRPKGTGSQRIYDELKRRILAMQMTPGTLIDEFALATEFAVSRTPVREALIRLSTDGLVSLLPNRGASVSSLDLDEIPALLEALEICLRVTTRLAALRRTDAHLEEIKRSLAAIHEAGQRNDYLAMSEANTAFHLTIARCAGNRYFLKQFQDLIPQYHRITVAIVSSSIRHDREYKTYFSDIDAEHQALFEAIKSRDSDLADNLALEHARLIARRLEKYIWAPLANPMMLHEVPASRPKGRRGTSGLQRSRPPRVVR